ncbi:MAG: hypothetical protein JWN93_1279 [Hyphomicrobiales bacterium]|nr:hypothetical protein [Hyphomicrobiales bacterium]
MMFKKLALGAALVLASAGAFAQQQNVNLRGVIAAVEANALSVRTNDGRTIMVDIPEGLNVSTTKAFTMADIKPGMPLGVTTIVRPDGAVVAIDVRPIPATAPSGLSPYDLQPQSTMTNAVLEASAAKANGSELTLNYKTGTVTVLVTPETAMSQSAPGSRADLKAGEAVYVAARKGEGDRYTAVRVQVGKDGVKPTQ